MSSGADSPKSSSAGKMKYAAGSGDGKWEVVGSKNKVKKADQDAQKSGSKVGKSKLPQSTRMISNSKDSPGRSRGSSSKQQQKSSESLKTVAQGVLAADVREAYKDARDMFPDSPLVCCKQLVDFVNHRLATAAPDNSHFNKQPTTYPLDQFPRPLTAAIEHCILGCTSTVLVLLWEHLLRSLSSLAAKAQPSYGYQAVVQIIAKQHPQMASSTDCCEKFVSLVIENKSQPHMSLPVLWALGQCGSVDYNAGLRVWLEVMMPVLGIKKFTILCVDYLERLLQTNDFQCLYGVVSSRQYFLYLDGTFNSQPNFPTEQQKRLKNLYPSIKTMAFGENPGCELHKFFPSFLSRLGGDSRPGLQKEVLDCLTQCLAEDPKAFPIWRDIYLQYVDESSVLLSHLLDPEQQDQVSALDQSALLSACRYFAQQNSSAQLQSREAAHAVSSLTKELTKRGPVRPRRQKSSGGCCWSLFKMLMMTALLGAIVGYILISYKPSGVVDQYASALGLPKGFLLPAQQQLTNFLKKSQVVLADVNKQVGPWAQRMYTGLSTKCAVLAQACQPYVSQLKPYCDWVHKAVLTPALVWSQRVWEATCQWVKEKDIWNAITKYFHQVS